MAQNPEEIEREIEQARAALAEKVDSLVGQVRHGVDEAKSKGLKVAAIAFAAIGVVTLLRRFRNRG